jgi:hypothetical protein
MRNTLWRLLLLSLLPLGLMVWGRAGSAKSLPQVEPPHPCVIDAGDRVITVEELGDGERVTVREADGQLVSISVCSFSGLRYEDIVSFFDRFQEQVLLADSDAVAAMMHYPLRVNSMERVFADPTELLDSYDTVFNAEMIEQIRSAEPASVFCNSQGTMLGNGVVWAYPESDAVLKVIAINQ